MSRPHEKASEAGAFEYTNADGVFGAGVDVPYLALNLDTWYYSEWEDPNHFASLGTMDVGEGPITADRGVGNFVTRQVLAFRDAFLGLAQLTAVDVSYKPRLEDVVTHAFHFGAPSTVEDQQAMSRTLETAFYGGITEILVRYDLMVTLRNYLRGAVPRSLAALPANSYALHSTPIMLRLSLGG